MRERENFTSASKRTNWTWSNKSQSGQASSSFSLRSLDLNAGFDTEVVVNVYSYAHDRPYNYESVRCPRGQEQTRSRGNNGHRRETELWCENQWRTGQVSWIANEVFNIVKFAITYRATTKWVLVVEYWQEYNANVQVSACASRNWRCRI